jgi:hypothetical protein
MLSSNYRTTKKPLKLGTVTRVNELRPYGERSVARSFNDGEKQVALVLGREF